MFVGAESQSVDTGKKWFSFVILRNIKIIESPDEVCENQLQVEYLNSDGEIRFKCAC